MRKEFKCCACGVTKEYSPINYAGASDELAKQTQTSGDICKPCRENFSGLKKKQNQELEDWLAERKVKTGG